MESSGAGFETTAAVVVDKEASVDVAVADDDVSVVLLTVDELTELIDKSGGLVVDGLTVDVVCSVVTVVDVSSVVAEADDVEADGAFDSSLLGVLDKGAALVGIGLMDSSTNNPFATPVVAAPTPVVDAETAELLLS